MTYQEKRAILLFLSTLIYLGGFIWYKNIVCNDITISHDNISFWANFVAYAITFKILYNIALTIGLNTFYRTSTKEKEPAIVDEFDRIVQLKSLQNAFITFMLGMLIGIIGAANGLTISAMFNIFAIAFFASEVISGISQLYFYRKGV
jgi:hypothetical protein